MPIKNNAPPDAPDYTVRSDEAIAGQGSNVGRRPSNTPGVMITNEFTTAYSEDDVVRDNVGLSHDLLRGAEEIAAFMFGSKKLRRKVYHLAETSRLPVFRLGSVLCARRSVLMAWIADQEQRALRGAASSNSSQEKF